MLQIINGEFGELYIQLDKDDLSTCILSRSSLGDESKSCWLNPQQLEDLIEKLQDIHEEITNE